MNYAFDHHKSPSVSLKECLENVDMEDLRISRRKYSIALRKPDSKET